MKQARNAGGFVGRSEWTPEDGRPLTKFVIPQRKIDEQSRRITFTISTGARDRDGDVIEQSGWELDDYRKNPVVLWGHDGYSPPVARSESVMVEGGNLVSVARFAAREEYEFADTVFRLYKGGFLSATSVGFEPMEMELMDGLDPGDIGFRFRRQKLLEYSCVPIPSNPEALVVARSKGIDVAPCDKMIERMLDEHTAGRDEELLNKTYVALHGRLHAAMQYNLAARNVEALRSKSADGKKAPDEEAPMLTVGSGGNDSHAHTFRHGEAQTEAGGEDGHVHAVTYSDDGTMIIEAAEGHTHDAPAAPAKDEDAEEAKRNGDNDTAEDVAEATPTNNPFDPQHFGEPEGQRGAAPAVDKVITDWPQPGMSLPVSLLTSEYRLFPIAEAKALAEDWPEIWSLGEGEVDEVAETPIFGDSPAENIRYRERWAAKHVDDFDLVGVVSQVRHLVRGSRGIEYMRMILSKAKEAAINERDKAKGLSPEEIDAVTDRVIAQAVMPVLEQTLRRYSGRVS